MSRKTPLASRLTGVALTGAALAGALGLGAGDAPRAADPLSHLVTRLSPYAEGLDEAALRRACGADLPCAAKRIVSALGPPASLEVGETPGTDTIRWAETLASLGAVRDLADGRRLIALERFGRKLEPELSVALADRVPHILLDLRANTGGDFGRMLRAAGLLIGPRAGAVVLSLDGRRERLDLPAVGAGARPQDISVLVGPETASSAEVLAALLRRHGGAQVLGARTAGKDYLLRVVPVDHDWRLLVPAERIEVPGETLAGGLIPDRPMPPALLAALAP